MPEYFYRIRFRGALDARQAAWFDGLCLNPAGEEGESLLLGWLSEKAALHGVIARIHGFGLEVLSVEKFNAGTEII